MLSMKALSLQSVYVAFLFPVKIVWTGLWSLAWWTDKEDRDRLRKTFESMKAFEVLLESALQCLLNILYNIAVIAVLREQHEKITYICYVSLSFSLLSLLAGIFR